MRIGIVYFSKRPKKNDSLQQALHILGHDISIVKHTDDWYNIVKSSHKTLDNDRCRIRCIQQ